MIDLFDELAKIAEVLDRETVPYALVGGIGYSVWVEVRNTEDIDFLVLPEDWERLPQLFEPLGYLTLAAPMDFADIRIRRLTKIEEDDSLVLDFLFADDERHMADVRQPQRLEFMGKTFSVAKPETIISLKESRMSPKDKMDIEGLKRVIEGDQ